MRFQLKMLLTCFKMLLAPPLCPLPVFPPPSPAAFKFVPSSAAAASAYHIAIGRLLQSPVSSLESSVSFWHRLCYHDFHHLLNVFLGFQVPQTHTYICMCVCVLLTSWFCHFKSIPVLFPSHPFPARCSLAFCNLLVFFSALYKLCSVLSSSVLSSL